MTGKSILDEELADLHAHLRVNIDKEEVDHVPEAFWQERLHGISPAELYQRFAKVGGSGDTVRVAVNLFTADRPDSSIDILHNVPFGLPKNDDLIRFGWAKDKAYIGWAQLRAEEQNQHLGKHYMKAGVQLMRAMGMQEMEVAAAEMGSYAWAKYGFVPNAASLEFVQQCVSDIVQGALYAGPNLIHAREVMLTDDEKKVLKHFIAAKPEEAKQLFTQIAEMNRVVGDIDGHPLTVGKAILYDMGWVGILPLKDGDPNYQRFCDYVDIAPTREQGKHGRA